MKNYILYLCPKLIDFSEDKTLFEDMETVVMRILIMVFFWGTLKKLGNLKGLKLLKSLKLVISYFLNAYKWLEKREMLSRTQVVRNYMSCEKNI